MIENPLYYRISTSEESYAASVIYFIILQHPVAHHLLANVTEATSFICNSVLKAYLKTKKIFQAHVFQRH
jgi:hypothetical protein